MKKIKALKLNFNKKIFFLYFVIVFILLTFIVAGSTLMGLGFINFMQFLDFKSYYSTLRPDLIGFDHAWNTYNNLASTNGWTKANIEMFIIGTILLILFVISLITFIVFFLLKKQKNKNNLILNSEPNIDLENVDSKNNIIIKTNKNTKIKSNKDAKIKTNNDAKSNAKLK